MARLVALRSALSITDALFGPRIDRCGVVQPRVVPYNCCKSHWCRLQGGVTNALEEDDEPSSGGITGVEEVPYDERGVY